MSAESGWYVLDTGDGLFLVAHHSSFYPEDLTVEELIDAFNESIEFDTEKDAMHHAQERVHEELVCELGVVFLTLDDAGDVNESVSILAHDDWDDAEDEEDDWET